jgi:DNA invertase Pin-like site-specific DNA recombinase/transposase
MSRSFNSRRTKEAAEMSKSLNRRVVELDVPSQGEGSSWDEFSILCAGPAAVIVAPPKPPPSRLKVAVYARYSTDAQKESSIRRQETNCATYYRTLGVQHHTLFADEGMSASSSILRVSLQELLDLCDKKEFDIIVVEDFDRWSRDLFDSVKIAERLDLARVQLHCAAVRRHLSLDDVVQLAMAAQHDKLRRRNLCMAGVDQLIVENHGMPWGAFFGYVDGELPGHPKKNPEQAKTIQRAFELGLNVSAAITARTLGEEGHLSPSGNLLWSISMVAFIWSCTTYAGLVRYRKTLCEQNRTTGKVTREPRPAYQYVQAYNEEFAIVTKDLFMAVQKAKRSRSNGIEAAATRRRPGPVFLFGDATCDCEGAVGQRFYPTNNRYACSLDRARRACLSSTTVGFQIETIDRAILAVVSAALVPRMEEKKLKEEFRSDLEKKTSLLDGKRREIALELEKAEMDADDLLDPEFVRGASPARIQARRQKAEERVDQLRSDLASVPKFDHLTVDYDEQTVRLRDAFELVSTRIPFLPVTADDHKLVLLLRKLVKSVRVLRQDRLAGKIGIEIDVQWAALFLSPVQVDACGYSIETLSTEVVLKRNGSDSERSRQYWQEVAASGVYALTDAQWQLVEPHLLDISGTGYGENAVISNRQIADAVIFNMRTRIDTARPPAFFGEQKALAKAMLRFIFAGGVETLVEVIGGADPKWLEGLDVQFLAKKRRGTSKRQFSRDSERAACWDGKTFHLTDEQWDRVKEVIDPRIEAPKNRPRRSVSARRLLDGIFVRLRTDCVWEKMPPEYGGRELKLAAMAMVYLGTWDRVLETLRKEFPDVLAGLNTRKMGYFPKRGARKAKGKTLRNGKHVSTGSDSPSANRSKSRRRRDAGEGGRREGAGAGPQEKSA